MPRCPTELPEANWRQASGDANNGVPPTGAVNGRLTSSIITDKLDGVASQSRLPADMTAERDDGTARGMRNLHEAASHTCNGALVRDCSAGPVSAIPRLLQTESIAIDDLQTGAQCAGFILVSPSPARVSGALFSCPLAHPSRVSVPDSIRCAMMGRSTSGRRTGPTSRQSVCVPPPDAIPPPRK